MAPLSIAAVVWSISAMAVVVPARGQGLKPSPSARPRPSASESQRDTLAQLGHLRAEIIALNSAGIMGHVPPADSFIFGDRTIPSGSTVRGSVAVANGKLDVSGLIDGDAVSIGGDVLVHRGAVINGDAVAVGGRVISDGGRVNGDMRSLSGIEVPAAAAARTAPAASPSLTTWQAIKLTFGSFAILAFIAFGVLIFAEKNLEGVATALEASFSKAFWYGVLGQLAALPVLLLLLLALCITVVGVLLIPFAIVAYVIACAGIVTLGFLAVARIIGSVFTSVEASASTRGSVLRALLVGLVAFGAVWLAASALAALPYASDILRALAIAVTWVAATAGMGAALYSRAGTHRISLTRHERRPPADQLAWQTPTPVAGVAAAKRPLSSTASLPSRPAS